MKASREEAQFIDSNNSWSMNFSYEEETEGERDIHIHIYPFIFLLSEIRYVGFYYSSAWLAKGPCRGKEFSIRRWSLQMTRLERPDQVPNCRTHLRYKWVGKVLVKHMLCFHVAFPLPFLIFPSCFHIVLLLCQFLKTNMLLCRHKRFWKICWRKP